MKSFFKKNKNYIYICITAFLILGIISHEIGIHQYNNKAYEIKRGTVFQLYKTMHLKSGRCTWAEKGNSLYGIYYSSRHLFPSEISHKTKWQVLWITEKSVLIPGLTRTNNGIDTTILAQNIDGKEIYIVAVSGLGLDIIYKDREVCYEGKAEKISLENLNKILKVIEP